MTANTNLSVSIYINNRDISTTTRVEQHNIRGLRRFNDTVYLIQHENATGVYEEVVGALPSGSAGVEWVHNSSCKFDNCVRLDGNNNYYSIPDSPIYRVEDSFS